MGADANVVPLRVVDADIFVVHHLILFHLNAGNQIFHDHVLDGFRREFDRLATNTVNELVLYTISNVGEEVGCSRRDQRITTKDFGFVDFGDISVVVLAPDFTLEIVNIDPVVT